jgi:Uma2 family endonuclease
MAIETTLKVKHHLFTVDDYYRMAEAGIFHEDDRVELIRGEIVEMTPIGSVHASVVDVLNSLLGRALTREQAIVRVQNPARLDQRSEPQPDIMLLRPRSDFYRSGHPGPSEVLLLIEVSDTSLAYDRSVKLSLYAQAGIAEVWIIDIEAETVEVNRDPESGSYAIHSVVARRASVSPQAFPEIRLSVDEILGTNAAG